MNNTKRIRLRCEVTKEMIVKEMSIEDVVATFKNMVYKNALGVYEDIKYVQHNMDDVEDINSLGMIELIKCYDSYKDDKSAFSTYLNNALDKLNKRIHRDLFAEKRTTDKGIVSLEGETEELDALQDLMGVDDEFLNLAELDCDVIRALKEMNEEEKKIINFLMQEIKTKKEFAKELGVTRPTLDVRITKVKEKLASFLEGYNW